MEPETPAGMHVSGTTESSITRPMALGTYSRTTQIKGAARQNDDTCILEGEQVERGVERAKEERWRRARATRTGIALKLPLKDRARRLALVPIGQGAANMPNVLEWSQALASTAFDLHPITDEMDARTRYHDHPLTVPAIEEVRLRGDEGENEDFAMGMAAGGRN